MKSFIHSRPMGSLDNCFEEQDLKKFLLKIKTEIEKTDIEKAMGSGTTDVGTAPFPVSVSQSQSQSESETLSQVAMDAGSVENILSEELDLRNVSFVVEPKIDGLSMCIRYDINGVLLAAGTRGDGAEGEDVTANIQVRGEVRMGEMRQEDVSGTVQMR